MSIKFNGTSISKITYNNTDLTVLKYNDTPIWGKPYTLTLSAGNNSSITVTRTSSPNENASTGTLTNGATIYQGDILTIAYSVTDGYRIDTSTINGTTFTSGSSFTVTGNLSVATTAVSSKSWHTVWSGSKSMTTLNGATTFNGILADAEKTRITANATVHVYIEDQETWDIESYNVTYDIVEKETGCGMAINYDGSLISYDKQSSDYLPSNYPIYVAFKSVSSNTLNCSAVTDYTGFPPNTIAYVGLNFTSRGIKITKIEQYY